MTKMIKRPQLDNKYGITKQHAYMAYEANITNAQSIEDKACMKKAKELGIKYTGQTYYQIIEEAQKK